MPNKFLLATIVFLMLVFMAGCGGETKTKETSNEPAKEAVNTEPARELTEAEKIEKVIRNRIEEGEYRNVHLDGITVNKNMAANDGTYIALVYLKFDVKNTKNTGNKMMRMYSDDLVATLASKGAGNVREVAVFWEDEYNGRSLKYAYEYRNGGFYLTSAVE